MSHFYKLFHTIREKILLLIARGYERDEYLRQLIEDLDEEQQLLLDPVKSELNNTALILTDKIWQLSYNLQNIFFLNMPE